ncbi:MAG: fatty-acyl-CoA synthase [Granulosicoccus sp.]|jgi:fatty-acyl-CoA synthase
MSLYRRLKVHASLLPEKLAIEFEDSSLSYSQLLERVDQHIAYFNSLKLKSGNRIAFLALNHPDIFVAVFAAAQTGLVLVPLNWRLSVDELQYVIDDCNPSLLLHDAEFANTAHELISRTIDDSSEPIKLQPIGQSDIELVPINKSASEPVEQSPQLDEYQTLDRPLLIVYTSGTTGRPKGAVLNQKALLCSSEMTQHMLDLTFDDHVLNVLPLFHVGGLNIQPLPALLFGASLYLHTRFNPVQTAQAISKNKITLLNSVPTVLQAIVDSNEWASTDVSALRAISIGSTDVPVQLINQVQQRGIPLIQVYGATETSPVAIYQKIEHASLVGSIGRAGSHCEVRIADDKNEIVEPGLSGEIQVKGDNILSYYWNNPEATESNLVDGWFKTGDVAHEDKNGFYWFDDRLKHVIISGGENIYPAELERVIRVIDGVEAISVVGKPDARWGEVPVAVVVGTADVASIKNVCTQLARFKQPKDIIFVDDLPRNALGKIQVHLVKDLVISAIQQQ